MDEGEESQEGGGGGGVEWINGIPTGIPRVTIETSFANPAPSTGFSNLSQNPEFPSPAPGCDKPGGSHLPVEITGAALEQHDQLFYSQLLQLRQQQAAQQQLLQQQYTLQRQLLLENQEKTLKSHFLEYIDQHKRLEEMNSRLDQENKKSDVKYRLQEFVLQKKQREIMNSFSISSQPGILPGAVPGVSPRSGSHDDILRESTWNGTSETESTDAEVSSLLSSNSAFFRTLPRISPVQEDEYLPSNPYLSSSRSPRSMASPLSLGSSSSSILEDYRGYLAAPPQYLPSPPRHGKLRPVGRTQSAPLPLGHPGLLAPPDIRQGKTSPELDTHALVKQQIRQSVLSRQNRSAPGDSFKSLDPMLAMAELSQIQTRCMPNEDSSSPGKSRHSSQDGGSKSKPKPISRTRSSPLVTLGSPGTSLGRTGLAWDPVMLQHSCLCGDELLHPESPGRVERIVSRLRDTGLLSRCELVRRRATIDELKTCHVEDHVKLFGVSPLVRGGGGGGAELLRLPCGGWGVDTDTVWNEVNTPTAAKVAAGSLIELVNKVGSGTLRNGFGLIRPPGHHAEENQALGFCYFNNIAISARQFRRNFKKRVVILDWDVHHGNGTQKAFYSDPEVLYISMHRHDGGNFFPGTGSPEETGSGEGLGANVNIAWSLNERPLGDAEYLAALRAVVLPIIKSFCPGIILVSAGFDATAGHPSALGGYSVSPACFGVLTSYLMQLAEGKLVLGLEGGYVGEEVAESVVACIRTLLGEGSGLQGVEELNRPPTYRAVQDINTTINHHISHWPVLAETCKFVNITHSQYLDSHPLDLNSVRRLHME